MSLARAPSHRATPDEADDDEPTLEPTERAARAAPGTPADPSAPAA